MGKSKYLRIFPEKRIVPASKVTELDIVVEINTAQKGKSKPQPNDKHVNLCVVIDRSGSMAGHPLEIAKQCCKSIAFRLSSNDRFTLVAFSDMAETVVTPITPKEMIEFEIDKIIADGSTDLVNGWRQGLLELQSYSTEIYTNRLILLSDGKANRGETKTSILAEESSRQREENHITTSTIGIGASFDEDILAVLSYESGGRFHAIRDAQIEDIINVEFKGSLATQFERPRVKLELPEGVQIVEEFNALKKFEEKYRIRPILDSDVFNFALRIRIDPKKIVKNEFDLVGIFYDGNGIVEQYKSGIKLGTEEESVKAEANPLVRTIVEKYNVSISEDETIENLTKGNLHLITHLWQRSTDDLRSDTATIRPLIAGRDRTIIEQQRSQETIDTLDSLGAMFREAEMVEQKLNRREVFLVLFRIVRELRALAQEKYNSHIANFSNRLAIALRHDQQMSLSGNVYNMDTEFLESYLVDTAEEAFRLLETLVRDGVGSKELTVLKEDLNNALKSLG